MTAEQLISDAANLSDSDRLIVMRIVLERLTGGAVSDERLQLDNAT